jgi:hypothetical protein
MMTTPLHRTIQFTSPDYISSYPSEHTPKIRTPSIKVQTDSDGMITLPDRNRTKIESIVLEVLSGNLANFVLIVIAHCKARLFVHKH